MALEYIYDAIKASAGEDIAITARISDEDTNYTADCYLELSDDNEQIARIVGDYVDGIWEFVIPADVTKGLKGRYWYSIHYNDTSLSFNKPIYLA